MDMRSCASSRPSRNRRHRRNVLARVLHLMERDARDEMHDSGERSGGDPGRQGPACGRDRSRLPALLMLTAILLFTSCSSSPPSGSPGNASPSPSTTDSTSDQALRLVVLGDSIASGETCAGCTTYPEQLATAMGDSLGLEVETRNLAVPGAEVANLLELVRTDSTVQGSIAQADAILVTIGLNDLAFGRLDDPCDVAPHFPRVRWSSITHACVDGATAE